MASYLSNILGYSLLAVFSETAPVPRSMQKHFYHFKIQTVLTPNWIMNALVIRQYFCLCAIASVKWSIMLKSNMFALEVHISLPNKISQLKPNWELHLFHLPLLTSISTCFMLLLLLSSPHLFFVKPWCVCRERWHVFACSPSPKGMQSKVEIKPVRKGVQRQREKETEAFKALKGEFTAVNLMIS